MTNPQNISAPPGKGSRAYLIILLAGVYAILPFLLAATYNQPAADDYFSAVRDAHTGFMPALRDSYLHWSGRYFAMAVSRINPLLFHSVIAYKAYAVLLIILFIAALHALVRQVAGRYLSIKQTAALTALFTNIYFIAMPSTAEGFYWFSGAWVYQLANVLFMLLMAALIKLKRSETNAAHLLYFICSIVLAVCIAGSNEISLIITCICVGVFTWHVYRRRLPAAKYFITLTIVSFVAAAIAGFAPGNFERLNHQQEYSSSFVWTLAGGAAITAVYLVQWLIQVIIASFIYVPLWGNALAKKMVQSGACYSISIKRAVIIFAVIITGIQFFTVWAAGGSNAGRIENVIYLFFITGYFLILQLYLVKRHGSTGVESINMHHLLFKAAVVLFAAGVLDINNNVSTAWLDLVSGKAKKYDSELNERANVAVRCIQDTCFTAPLTTLPKTIFFTDIKSTSDSIDLWMNQAYTSYFGKGYIITNAPLPPVQSNMETLKNLGREIRENVFKK